MVEMMGPRMVCGEVRFFGGVPLCVVCIFAAAFVEACINIVLILMGERGMGEEELRKK